MVAQVQIKCPNSGLWTSTGIDVEPQSWASEQVAEQDLMCPICGQTHVWTKDESRLVPWA